MRQSVTAIRFCTHEFVFSIETVRAMETTTTQTNQTSKPRDKQMCGNFYCSALCC